MTAWKGSPPYITSKTSSQLIWETSCWLQRILAFDAGRLSSIFHTTLVLYTCYFKTPFRNCILKLNPKLQHGSPAEQPRQLHTAAVFTQLDTTDSGIGHIKTTGVSGQSERRGLSSPRNARPPSGPQGPLPPAGLAPASPSRPSGRSGGHGPGRSCTRWSCTARPCAGEKS